MNAGWPATGLTWVGGGGEYTARLPGGDELRVDDLGHLATLSGSQPWRWSVIVGTDYRSGAEATRAEAMRAAERAAREMLGL